MKKISGRLIFFMAVVIFACIPAIGQLRYGFRFGGSFASASLKDAPGYSLVNRSGFSGGLALEYQSPKIGLGADIALLYTRFNSRLRDKDGSLSSFGRNFIEVPLHIKYKFPIKATSELFSPMIYTGPSLLVRLDKSGASAMDTHVVQPGWDVGIGFDIINFIQISGGYRFGLGNGANEFAGAPDAVYHTDGWNVSATLLFDF